MAAATMQRTIMSPLDAERYLLERFQSRLPMLPQVHHRSCSRLEGHRWSLPASTVWTGAVPPCFASLSHNHIIIICPFRPTAALKPHRHRLA
jgi:hypothetical protein